jgi:hypothetical protein
VVSNVRIENVEVARAALADLRLSLVPRAPGFVSAYWIEPVDGVGLSVIVFETKEHAEQAAAYPVPPLPGVTPLSVQVREVYASA